MPEQAALAATWQDALQRMLQRIQETARRDLNGFPHFADPDTGTWTVSPDGDWTGGFWVGELWLAAGPTGAEPYRTWARTWSEALRPRARSRTIFRSFLFYYGAALGDILLGDMQAREIALEGARGLATLYNDTVGVIPLGTEAEEVSDVGDTEVSIDAVGAIAALFGWAAEQTGDASFRDKATRHTQRHLEWLVREDGSVRQSATFDPRTGQLVRRYTHKGYAEDSTWARAQAWGLLGFTEAARWLAGRDAFVHAATRVADWWLEHVPADRVAFWDFDDPAIPHTERDTSATAIAAASLLKLSELVRDPSRASRYRTAAQATVQALVTDYLTPTGPIDRRPPGMLTHGCYNKRTNMATRNELIWGDYYLFEALNVLTGAIRAALV